MFWLQRLPVRGLLLVACVTRDTRVWSAASLNYHNLLMRCYCVVVIYGWRCVAAVRGCTALLTEIPVRSKLRIACCTLTSRLGDAVGLVVIHKMGKAMIYKPGPSITLAAQTSVSLVASRLPVLLKLATRLNTRLNHHDGAKSSQTGKPTARPRKTAFP